MKALVLDGNREGETAGDLLKQVTVARLEKSGYEVETHILREEKFAPCAGDFFCWIRNPGECHMKDDNLVIAAEVMRSDLLVFLTPITFGGYSSHLKSLLDHLIQNVSPFFESVNGETHHQPRYSSYPDFMVVGLREVGREGDEAIFHQLAWRNSINIYSRSSAVVLVNKSDSVEMIGQSVTEGLASLSRKERIGEVALPERAKSEGGIPPERVLLLVGSPRMKTSSSLALGTYLVEEMAGVSFDIHFTHQAYRSSPKMEALLTSVDRSDLIVFVFPLYFDSIPAPAIYVMEKIAEHQKKARATPGHEIRFVALANSGFPEAKQNDTALAICESFARSSGFIPAGTLAIGGGEGLVHRKALRNAHGPIDRTKRGLRMTAGALQNGGIVPEEARELLAKPFIPTWLYRWMGGLGWKIQARKYKKQKELRKRPYA